MLAIAKVIFRSALTPRSRGSEICSLWCPASAQPIEPNPGINPIQFEKSININKSKEIGIKFGEKISKLGFKQVIFDRGGYLYHGNVAAIADGIRESGIEV